MRKVGVAVLLILSCVVVFVESYGGRVFDPLSKFVKGEPRENVVNKTWTKEYLISPVYVGLHDGLKEADKIESLPGQPDGVDFDQYSGYVTVDPRKGRALFYYFAESPHEPSTKPLVLWLSGGPGCSSFGNGAMMELGPFRVKSDGKTLSRNEYAWNNVANIIFLESPVGVGFSYSNTTLDIELNGDVRTAKDSYTFLINWLERFPEYKARDFFIAGESYAGHYVPQLAQLILHKNKNTNQTIINLRGIAIGNGLLDDDSEAWGRVDFYWTHFFISDEIKKGVHLNCKSLVSYNESDECSKYKSQVYPLIKNIYVYDIYAPLCNSSRKGTSTAIYDPCSENYTDSYLNNPWVQDALHANVTSLPGPWKSCSGKIAYLYKDQPASVLPVIQELMASDISVWLYSGDTDGRLPTTTTKYAIQKLGPPVKTPWYPWTTDGEVGGFAVEYENLTFLTVRGAGHFVPSYQPARALTLFSSFLDGKLPPVS